ncbi:unnamed protein product, partial [Polarella glacialis]
LNHPNIVRFWRGSTEIRNGTRSLLMVTEFVKQGSLSRLLHGHGGPALPEPLTLPQALSFGLDIARGVQYLHTQRILHLDLKSPNVLCAPVWTAKLCDFGLAKMRGEQTAVQSTLQGVSPVWAPPEMFEKGEGLTEKADVYSFGVIFFELLTKQVPFSEVSPAQLPASKLAGHLPKVPAAVPADCAGLVHQCCAARPASRPSMNGALARVRELAQAHNVTLSEVRPPAALLRYDDDQERRVQQAEEAAALRLKEVDKQRAQLRPQLAELQRQIEAARRRAVVQLSGLGAGAASPGGTSAGTSSETLSPTAVVDDSWCEPFIQVGGSKFRCSLCSKLFRGPEFVRRHVAAKHRADVGRLAEDKYFDCDVSREDSLPVHLSLHLGENGISRKVLSAAAVLGAGRFSQALQDAAEQGDASQVGVLLGLRADPGQRDDGGTGPLALAARNGHLAVAEALLAAAAERGGAAAAVEIACHTSGAGLTPLHMAASENRCDVLQALLQHKAVVDTACSQGKTPLLHAGENGHLDACSLLLKLGADAASRTPDGETLLHVVARFGDASLIAQVVNWKADLSVQDRDGWSEAARWGAAAVESLCGAKASVHAKSKDGETPLHVALEGFEQASACEALLKWWRADPLATDNDGETPLHVAARRDDLEACKVLLQGGAEPQPCDLAGRSLDLCPQGGEAAAGFMHSTVRFLSWANKLVSRVTMLGLPARMEVVDEVMQTSQLGIGIILASVAFAGIVWYSNHQWARCARKIRLGQAASYAVSGRLAPGGTAHADEVLRPISDEDDDPWLEPARRVFTASVEAEAAVTDPAAKALHSHLRALVEGLDRAAFALSRSHFSGQIALPGARWLLAKRLTTQLSSIHEIADAAKM